MLGEMVEAQWKQKDQNPEGSDTVRKWKSSIQN